MRLYTKHGFAMIMPQDKGKQGHDGRIMTKIKPFQNKFPG